MAITVDVRENVAQPGATQVNNISLNTTYTVDHLDRACIHALRCPNTLEVKIRLKEKGKLLHGSINWIIQDPQFLRWQEDHNTSLLWIKGGAGKGKTMITIGLVEQLSLPHELPPIVAYFFCQNTNYELNTIEGIIKGLILCLVNEEKELREPLRRRWDNDKGRFKEDLTSWRTLWNVFLEMLDCCKRRRIYVIIDALDECRDNNIAQFLQLIVRTGLSPKTKWLVTSRPFDSAHRELLTGSDQVVVSLDLNSEYVAEAVKIYIVAQVAELDHRQNYGPALRQRVEAELTEKSGDTFLWVSLVCKRLESICRADVLTTIKELPSGLLPFYRRIFDELFEGEPAVVEACTRLLKVMLIVYRPLTEDEVSSVTGIHVEEITTKLLVDRCASFVRKRGPSIEFVHQSARDYLAQDAQSILESHGNYRHGEVALSCLSYLSRQLKVNFLNLPRPNSNRVSIEELKAYKMNSTLASMDYAATFWVDHLKNASHSTLIRSALREQGIVVTFLRAKLLEWFECLSLLDQLPRAVEAMKILVEAVQWEHSLLAFVQDATRFLLRHYQTIATWPLQIYSSAMVFSPRTSVVREANLDKIPSWLRNIPRVEETWTSLIQTLTGHALEITAVAFSPDGTQIASGSYDQTIKLWDAMTGDIQKTFYGHSNWVMAVAFSPDGTQIASGSNDRTVILWDTTTGDVRMKLAGHSRQVIAMAFSPDGTQIASGSGDKTIKLWNTTTGDIQKTFNGHSDRINTIAFSPDGTQIASGSDDKTIMLWDVMTGDIQKTLTGYSGKINTIAVSPDGTRIVSDSSGKTITLWDVMTGDVQKTLTGHSNWVTVVAFSPDGTRIASDSDDKSITLWDTTTGDIQKTFTGHSGDIKAITFSPDGTRIASGSDDKTIKMWDVTTSDAYKTPLCHLEQVNAVALSPDSTRIASGSNDKTIKLWDATTGEVQMTLLGHSNGVGAVAFSLDGTQIASGSNDKTIKLWDTTTGNVQMTLIGHTDWVMAVAFSPDGTQVASGSDDKTIKLWDTKTGEVQMTLVGHSYWVRAVAFSPDGTQIASGSYDDTIKIWDVTKSPKISKLFGRVAALCLKFRAWREIKTLEASVSYLKFSKDGRYFLTDLGPIKIESTVLEARTPDCDVLDLWVEDRWIYYRGVPVFRLTSDSEIRCYDGSDSQVAIGLSNGLVLSFDIDRRSLHSVLEMPAHTS